MSTAVEKIFKHYPQAQRDSLIPILQKIQDSQGYISRDAVQDVGKHLNLPASKIYGVATFYNQFRFHPQGRFHIQICRGTACHVKGSLNVLERLQEELGIQAGETTHDGLFSLEVVACIGACGLAPVISVNGNYHAKLKGDDIPNILNEYRNMNEEHSE